MMAVCSNTQKPSLSLFPSEILLQICSSLDFRSLERLGQTCKRFRDTCHDDSLWEKLCRTVYLLEEKGEHMSWQKLYQTYHHRIGRFHCPSVYRKIRCLWTRLETYLQQNDPEIFESLRGPCDMSEMNISESKMKVRFPDDLRCSLLIHNGQTMNTTNFRGLLGSIAIASYFTSQGLLDAASMARCFEPNWGELPGCVPVAMCPYSRKCQYIGVDERAGFTRGEIFYPILPAHLGTDIFITAKSFTEWLEDLVVKLETGAFPRIQGIIHRFEHEEGCVARSHGCFTVKVSTCFLPEVSTVNPGHFMHVYRVTMSMDEDAGPEMSCQLESRHWVITDMDGTEEIVDGDGVVGEFPEMEPGKEFSWVSCTTFSTTYGNMHGYFTMKNLFSGNELKIDCPCFQMRCLPYKQAAERMKAVCEKKKNL